MGTRHLICVVKDGEYKIAQYGQFDGHPGGQGLQILNFISKKKNLKKFRKALKKVRFIDYDGVDKKFIADYEANLPSGEDFRTAKQRMWFESFITRKLGAEILNNVANSNLDEIILRNRLNFAADGVFCEWAYVIDFDKKTFEVYRGFNKCKLNENDRFYGLPDDENISKDYEPARLVVSFDFKHLPSSTNFVLLASVESD